MTTSENEGRRMPWWGWLLIGFGIAAIPAAIILGFVLHGMYHFMDGF